MRGSREQNGLIMLSPSDITDSGFYWYLDRIGAPAVIVEVVRDSGEQLAARFTGREDEDLVSDLLGTFIGPLRASFGDKPPGSEATSTETAKAAKGVQEKMRPDADGRPSADRGGPAAPDLCAGAISATL
jgi:hypothetical protein